MTPDSQELIRRRLRTWCIWSWPVCVVVFGFGFVVLAGFIPPPREFWSAERIAQMYADNRTGIRAGIIVAMFASALLLPFYTVISAEIRKIEGPGSLLAPIQYAGAVILVAFFQIICLLWLLASLRPEADPQIIRAANDYCWLVWSTLIPTYVFQYLCMAIAGFMDKRPHPTWPRWAAYMNLWVGTIGAGGVLAVFFKHGPFAWHGLIGFWIPVILFAVGNSVTAVLLHRRAKYEAQQPETELDLARPSRVGPIAAGSAT